MNAQSARGIEVKDPKAALFKVRYPKALYITLKNKDIEKTPLSKPVTINYWIEKVDPELKASEYSTDTIHPEFTLDIVPVTTKSQREAELAGA